MSRTTRAVAAAILAGGLAATAAEDAVPLRAAAECTPRGGLPVFIAKAKAGGELRVGYLGGSITAAAGWRPKSLAWLQKEYPAAKLSEINAAIGGTGSDLGVFRVGQDVLRHKPDLLFVEFAVNDGGSAPERIHRAMEGIVRQTWTADPATDLCFVYTVSEPFLKDLQAGRCSRAATAMEQVADHYAIPSIHLGLEAARKVTEGTLVFKAGPPKDPPLAGAPMIFSADGVHPHPDTGHELYLEAIRRSWPALAAVAAAPAAHALKAPLRADNWEQAKIVPFAPAMMSGPWQKLDPAADGPAKSFATRMPDLWKATAPGASISFAFRGSAAAIYDLLGPDGGIVEVKIDDRPARLAPRIDGYCTYPRIAKLDLGSDFDGGTHRVVLTLKPDAPDKAKILFERNRADLEKNPAKYAPNVWHAASILLLGDIVP
ncbi:MAG: SGNH/GDSL hydrolase family protein [Lentisphaerae bacterium]|nr:SGNH/GDSL hydrolase family protein [Lentisphaerota bacterium]